MKTDKIPKESKNLIMENVEQIKKMFPEIGLCHSNLGE